MSESIYAKGLYFNKLHPDTPPEVREWKKGGVAVHVENFSAQLAELKQYADEKGYIKFDLTENEKDGEKFLSFRLNTWKPEKKQEASENINPEDVPF